MIINIAMTLAMAAGCLAAIATTLAAHAEAARRTVVVKHPRSSARAACQSLGLRARM